jgi:hypothetical protein
MVVMVIKSQSELHGMALIGLYTRTEQLQTQIDPAIVTIEFAAKR